jgi:hypothetical protein
MWRSHQTSILTTLGYDETSAGLFQTFDTYAPVYCKHVAKEPFSRCPQPGAAQRLETYVPIRKVDFFGALSRDSLTRYE